MKLPAGNSYGSSTVRPQDGRQYCCGHSSEPSGPKRGRLAGQLLVYKEELCLVYCGDDISDNGKFYVIKYYIMLS
jgi:hypothetical protein